MRQELDLRRLAREEGYRVVGVASDLNVSATKISPWKRKSLGEWLNNRVPEFDAILFWKMDRFVRSINDLFKMITWCHKYNKNLVSKNDQIDLETAIGKMQTRLGIVPLSLSEIRIDPTLSDLATTDWFRADQIVGDIREPSLRLLLKIEIAGAVLAKELKSRKSQATPKRLATNGFYSQLNSFSI